MFELLKRRLNGMPGQFRSNVWDPTLIIAQIVCMQSFYYVNLGFWIFILDTIGRFDASVDQIFTQSVSVDNFIFIYMWSVVTWIGYLLIQVQIGTQTVTKTESGWPWAFFVEIVRICIFLRYHNRLTLFRSVVFSLPQRMLWLAVLMVAYI